MWNLHTIFHNSCTNLHSHQWCISVSFSPHPYQHLLSVLFWIITILTDMIYVLWFWLAFPWWLMISDVEHFSCAYWPFMSYLEKYLFKSSAHFLNWVFCYFLLSGICFLNILYINILSGVSFPNIFSHSVGRLFIWMIVCFEKTFDIVVCFCFCFPCLKRHIQNIYAKTDVKVYTAYVFF